jgi:hypothetical protein
MGCFGLCSYTWDPDTQTWSPPSGTCTGDSGCACPPSDTIPPPIDRGLPAIAMRLCSVNQGALALNRQEVQFVFFRDEVNLITQSHGKSLVPGGAKKGRYRASRSRSRTPRKQKGRVSRRKR